MRLHLKQTVQMPYIAALSLMLLCLNAAVADEVDPFAELDVPENATPSSTTQAPQDRGFFHDNFTFKRELFLQVSHGPVLHAHEDEENDWYSRVSIGFEALKKFSSATSTVASFDFQGRLVHRDSFIPTLNDMEGETRNDWQFEYHNLYLDLYNILNPLLAPDQQGAAAGHFNFRVGRFYLPFGLNLQTDTHGTLLQLSNEQNFGFERDWYAGFWGTLSPELNYDLYYLLGSGYDLAFDGQDGMIGGRVSLANRFLNEYGLEAGASFLSGQRQSMHSLERSPGVQEEATANGFIQTERFGIDARYTHLIPSGSLTLTSELSFGEDESENITSHLVQADYLHRSRTWGLSTQFRRLYQARNIANESNEQSSVVFEATRYFRNDVGNTNLHWIKLNVERQLDQFDGPTGTVTTIQYYRYW